MPGVPQSSAQVVCRSPSGVRVATLEITPIGNHDVGDPCPPLLCLTDEEARNTAEEKVQLRERARYHYRITGAPDVCLCGASGVQPFPDLSTGLIETRDFCGKLELRLMRRGDAAEAPVACGSVEVRSLKLDYRTHYRGMLSYIAGRCAGLLLDSRAQTRLRLSSLWREDNRVLEQQLEFLRYKLDSVAFRCAVDEILRSPHCRLREDVEVRRLAAGVKPGKALARQIASAVRRIPVPEGHALHGRIASLPERITLSVKTEYFDTPENRFVKMALTEFRDFLAEVVLHLQHGASGTRAADDRLAREATLLRASLDATLARGFLPDVSMPSVLPFGSPVLQRKGGYRELYRFWLQFHAGARLVWKGGSDVFHAGARDVATLYEYWLFFQLEELFRKKFSCEKPLHAILVDKTQTPPHLVLKRGVALRTPVTGVWSQQAHRSLNAEFQFNRKFTRTATHKQAGSWTRGVQPDYTISVWPAELSREEAEERELMVHVHFDAKYRVERVREIMGDSGDDREFEEAQSGDRMQAGAAKYADLLKMHAYRDAIRRTAGAYVLYPGGDGDGQRFEGYHEVLPGLGAFAVYPDSEGEAKGTAKLSEFLDRVIEHLANRLTARERVTYHLYDTYRHPLTNMPPDIPQLHESDSLFGRDYRALPPAEHMVLVAWYREAVQIRLAKLEEGLAFVRLGKRRGALYVQPNLASVRHILLRSERNEVCDGLFALREPGFSVQTRQELRETLQSLFGASGLEAWNTSASADDNEMIYAVFKVREDAEWTECHWDGERLFDVIEHFEADKRNRPVISIRRDSPFPRILSLEQLLVALCV